MKMNRLKYLTPLIASVILVGCSSSSTEETVKTEVPDTLMSGGKAVTGDMETPDAPTASTLSLTFTATKVFKFTWAAVTGATSYKLTEAVADGSGYELVKEVTATSFDHIVPLYARLNAKYILQSCNAVGCTASAPVLTSTSVDAMEASIGYFKASNTGANDEFGHSMSISADGNTLAVGVPNEDSQSTGVSVGPYNGAADSGAADDSGAVYVFTRNNTSAQWSQQAYLKAGNADAGDFFGYSVSLSADGDTLVVGSVNEKSNGGDTPTYNVSGAGAVYVFVRTDTNNVAGWMQHDYIKATNPALNDFFGISVSLSSDGNRLAVGATGDNRSTGAVYVFIRNGTAWDYETIIQTRHIASVDNFGISVSLNKNGNTLAVGAPYEDSDNTGTGTNRGNNDARRDSGAVYVFARVNTTWSQQAFLKARNTGVDDLFGRSVSLSADGNTLAVGANKEDSSARGIDETGTDNAGNAGAAYVFARNTSATPATWSQQAYLKASNTDEEDEFGYSVSISADGNTLAVGAFKEDSEATGIARLHSDGEPLSTSGAVYTFTRAATTWTQQAYIKASNTGAADQFGFSVALSGDGGALAVGANKEGSPAIGVNADETGDAATSAEAGAVYVY